MSLFNRISGRGGGSTASTNPGNKQVCKFYLEGRCRFGDSCHNYHPPRDQASTTQNGKQQLPFHLSTEGIKADLTYGDDRPTWPLSSYGPGRDAPRQLIEGTLEQSPEELRVLYYLAKAGGSTQQYEQNERVALDEANQRAQQILNDVDGAIKYIIDAKDQHPNRDDQIQRNAGNFNWSEKPSNNQSTSQQTGASTFGQSSAFGGGSTSAFGGPSTFGSSAAASGSASTGGTTFGGGQSGSTSALGRPSSLGGGSSAFGQPSALGGGTTAFGQPSALGGSAFGGQGASTASPFAQSSLPTGTSSFGQSSMATGGSTFGQPSAPAGGSAFGQPSATASGSTFGKPSPFGAATSAGAPAFGSTTPFGAQSSATTSAFGQPSQPGQQQSPFGQPSQSAPQQSTFGQPSQSGQSQSAFGLPSQPGQQSAFGKPASLGTTATSTSTFGQPAFGSSTAFGASTGTSTFGRPSSAGQQQSAFGSGVPSTTFGSGGASGQTGAFGSPKPASPSASATSRPAGEPLRSFKGQAVTYEEKIPYYRNPNTGKQERIWFPDGPPGPNADVEASPNTYEALGAALQQVYEFVRESGTFKDGIVPEIPPKREWVSWDL